MARGSRQGEAPLIYFDTFVYNTDTIVLGGVMYCSACHPVECSWVHDGCTCSNTVTDPLDPRTGCMCTTGYWEGFDTLTQHQRVSYIDTLTNQGLPQSQWRGNDNTFGYRNDFNRERPGLNNHNKGPWYHPKIGPVEADFFDKYWIGY